MPRRSRSILLTTTAVALSLGATPAAAAEPPASGTVVTRGSALNVRSAPRSTSGRVDTLVNGADLAISCRTAGQFVRGPVTNTGYWDRLTDNTYVSDAYVSRDRAVDLPKCAPVAGGDWVLPVEAGLISGFRTTERPAHDGIDLDAGRGTPIRAAASGTVLKVVCNVSRGTCDTDGSSALRGCGWYVELLHPDGTVTRYCHMIRRPDVVAGQRVARGTILGRVGTSGASSGPHLHFEVHSGAPATRSNALDPIAFLAGFGLTVA